MSSSLDRFRDDTMELLLAIFPKQKTTKSTLDMAQKEQSVENAV